MRSSYWAGFLALALSMAGLGACGSSTSSGGTGGEVSGTGGSQSDGKVGGGGSGGAGGTQGTSVANPDGKLCPPSAQAMISDFSSANFGGTGSLSGGLYVYPTTDAYPLTSDLTGGNWHIAGKVGTYSGFGLFFDGCNRIDASAYAGISFKVSGTVDQDGSITLELSTLNDTITAAWLNSHGGSTAVTDPGRCLPPDSAANQWAQTTCAEPQQVIPVTTTPTVQNIYWADFAGGKPETAVTPSDITSIHWFLPNPPGAGTDSPTTYQADITIDDLSFIPK